MKLNSSIKNFECESMTTSVINALTGDALWENRLIWDSTNKVYKVYTGSAWQPLQQGLHGTLTLALGGGDDPTTYTYDTTSSVLVPITPAAIGAIPESEKGAARGVATLDSNGVIPITQIPQGALERMVIVADEIAAVAAVSSGNIQNGDTVKVTANNNQVFYVKDDTKNTFLEIFENYVVGFAALADYATTAGTAEKVANKLNIQLNSGVTTEYDGSTTKSINITPASIGAAVANHEHNNYVNAVGVGLSLTSSIGGGKTVSLDNSGVTAGTYENLTVDAYGRATGGYNDILAVCASSATTVAKTATLANFVLFAGKKVAVQFNYANTSANPTLNINSTGAKAMYYGGTRITGANQWQVNEICYFVYDGTQWQLLSQNMGTLTNQQQDVPVVTGKANQCVVYYASPVSGATVAGTTHLCGSYPLVQFYDLTGAKVEVDISIDFVTGNISWVTSGISRQQAGRLFIVGAPSPRIIDIPVN